MTDTLSFSREIPVRRSVDVFVAGGGPAGFAAAVAAARAGASVFLAEGQTCFGGMGTAGLVPAFMQFSDGEHFLAAGVGREIYDRLWEAGGQGPDDVKDRGVCVLGIRAETLKRLYDDMAAESGFSFSFLTTAVAAEATNGRVGHVVCWGKSGFFAVEAKMIVDATGDGDLAAWAGAPFEKGDENGDMMPGTLCSLWADVDWERVRASKTGTGGSRLADAFEAGVFTNHDLHLPGMWRVGRHVGGGNIGHLFGVDSTDERSLTEALLWGRKSLLEYDRYYREYLEGFETMELVATGALPGIRESRRITGDYVLDVEDFSARAVFDDEIGRYCYPVDIHPSKPDSDAYERFEEEFRTRFRYQPGESYGIPYRTLTPQGLDNVLTAGRCISADRYVQGSVRVMPGCYITGQAAGLAAAMAAAEDVSTRELSVAELQGRLIEMGAHLPNHSS